MWPNSKSQKLFSCTGGMEAYYQGRDILYIYIYIWVPQHMLMCLPCIIHLQLQCCIITASSTLCTVWIVRLPVVSPPPGTEMSLGCPSPSPPLVGVGADLTTPPCLQCQPQRHHVGVPTRGLPPEFSFMGSLIWCQMSDRLWLVS